jgi:exonuclease SbcC
VRLDRTRIYGITTFAEPVDIDATALPPGLIALVGENGTGKTTLLEAMAAPILDRRFVSRGDGQLVDYATKRDAYIDDTYTIEGRGTFRARVNLDGSKRVTDALLEQLHEGGGVTRLNDGKATTFDAAVRGIFPSKALLTATVFAAQNRRGSFLLASKSQRKDLFGELLGLEHYDTMAATAKQLVARLVTDRAVTQALADRRTAETTEEYQADLDGRAQQLTIALGENEEEAEALAAAIDAAALLVNNAQTALETARAGARSLDAATEKHATAVAERGKIAERRSSLDDALAREARAADTRYETAETRIRIAYASRTEAQMRGNTQTAIRAINDRLSIAIADLDARIEKNQGLIGRADEVREAAAKVTADDVEIAAATETIDIWQRALDAETARLRARELMLANTSYLPDALARAEQASALLDAVPCGGAPPYDGCSLLQSAVEARASIPALAAEIGQRAALRAEVDELTAEIADARNNLDVARADLATLKKAADSRRPLAAELAFLEAAEQRIADYRAERTRVTAAADEDRQREETALTTALAERQERVASIERELADAARTRDAEIAAARAAHVDAAGEITREDVAIAEKITALEAELADADRIRAAVTAAQDGVYAAEIRMRDLHAQRETVATTRARLLEQQASHHREIEALKKKLEERRWLMGRLDALEIEHDEWRALAQALGRDGLPTLEMDAAGPVVSDLCNDLLESALGSRRFTVELVTQEAKADGKGVKETFELKVTDSERGSEARDVTDLSGGEQVLLDEALKAAIAVFLNQRNERPLRTCWRDETTGALDPENALRYVAMLRRLQELAGFHQIFMVSHNPTVTAMADAQLQIAGGRVTVAYPPFATEAA